MPTRKPGPCDSGQPRPVCAPESPGSLGINDRADPNAWSLPGDVPGSSGINDHAPTQQRLAGQVVMAAPSRHDDAWSGAAPVGTGAGGIASVARIPIPGTNGLFVELRPRGWTPQGGSTSTLFLQDSTGRRHLRLDYGFNERTGSVNYHWNQKGTFAEFGIADHAEGGASEAAFYRGARVFRYAGRALLVVGVAADVYSIVVARKRWRQVLRVAAGWTGAWAGCELLGAGGAAAGTAVTPGPGTAAGALGGCFVGGIGGYLGFSWAAGAAYDWVEEHDYQPLGEDDL